MNEEIGWQCVDYDYEEIFDAGICFHFDYEGKTYWCCNDQDPIESRIYEMPDYKLVKTFYGKDDFYNGELFGRPFKDIVDSCRIYGLG